MLDRTRAFLRRWIFRTYRRLKHPRKLRDRPIQRWFARHFLDKDVWRPCQATFAGGAAVGVFVSLQLIPGQMPMAVILSALFRVNIPVAVVVAWISNPLTFAPIGYAEHQFGQWLMGFIGNSMEPIAESIENKDVVKGIKAAQAMYLGGFVSGLLASPIGYGVAWFGWTGFARLLKIPHRRPRKPRTVQAPPPGGGSEPLG